MYLQLYDLTYKIMLFSDCFVVECLIFKLRNYYKKLSCNIFFSITVRYTIPHNNAFLKFINSYIALINII